MINFKRLFCSHKDAVISEVTLGAEEAPRLEIGGVASIRAHLQGIHSRTFIQTTQCEKCSRISHFVVRHFPID